MEIPNNQELKKIYWDGNKNKSIRFLFYCMRGLDLFNSFRYILMTIFGIYLLFKLSNPIYFILMFLVSVPILIILGWSQVHHLSKVMDWLNVEFSTHWGRYGYELQEKQNKILSEINERIKQIGNSNNNRS